MPILVAVVAVAVVVLVVVAMLIIDQLPVAVVVAVVDGAGILVDDIILESMIDMTVGGAATTTMIVAPLLRFQEDINTLLVITLLLRIDHQFRGIFMVDIILIGVGVEEEEEELVVGSPRLPIMKTDHIGTILAITVVIVGANLVFTIGDHRRHHRTNMRIIIVPSIRVLIIGGRRHRRHCTMRRVPAVPTTTAAATATTVVHSGVSISANIRTSVEVVLLAAAARKWEVKGAGGSKEMERTAAEEEIITAFSRRLKAITKHRT